MSWGTLGSQRGEVRQDFSAEGLPCTETERRKETMPHRSLGPVSGFSLGYVLAAHRGGVASSGTRKPSSYQTGQILRTLLCHAEELRLFEESYRRGDRIIFVF